MTRDLAIFIFGALLVPTTLLAATETMHVVTYGHLHSIEVLREGVQSVERADAERMAAAKDLRQVSVDLGTGDAQPQLSPSSRKRANGRLVHFPRTLR